MNPLSKTVGTVYKNICAVMLALMVLIVFVNTVLRYCFNSGIVENEEVLRYLFIWITYLGIVAVYYEGNHISVTVLVDKFSPKTAAIFAFCANFLALLALGLLIYGGVLYCLASRTTVGELTKLPFAYIISAAIFCGIASACIVLRDMRTQLRTYNQLNTASSIRG